MMANKAVGKVVLLGRSAAAEDAALHWQRGGHNNQI
jgi:hypothetical protein